MEQSLNQDAPASLPIVSPSSPTEPLEVSPIPWVTPPAEFMSLEDGKLYSELGSRSLSQEETIRVSRIVSDYKGRIEQWIYRVHQKVKTAEQLQADKTRELARKIKAFEQSQARAERDWDRRKKEIEGQAAIRTSEALERAARLEAELSIMKAMPEKMDEAATREWLENNARKITLAGYLAIAQTSSDERIRMAALNRLSDEDRGRNGSLLRGEDVDTPGIMIVPGGKYGIPDVPEAREV